MTAFLPTSTTQTSGPIVDMVGGDYVYVAPDVILTDTDTSSYAIYDSSSGTAEIFGAVLGGFSGIYFTGAANQLVEIQIASGGSVTSLRQNGEAIFAGSGDYDINNSGDIIAPNNGEGITANGSGTIRNYGTIDGGSVGVLNNDPTTTDSSTLYNYGTIAGDAGAVLDEFGHTAFVYNYGSIVGGMNYAIYADGSTTETLVNAGSISGAVELAGVDSSFDNSGTVSGSVSLYNAGSSFANSGTIDGDITDVSSGAFANSGTIDGNVAEDGAGPFVDSGTIDGSVTFENAPGFVANIEISVGGQMSAAEAAAVRIETSSYNISNSGDIADENGNAVVLDGAGTFNNFGTISSVDGDGVFNSDSVAQHVFLANYGAIVGFNAVVDENGHIASIHNYGSIVGNANGTAILADLDTPETLVNSGSIEGEVDLGGASSSVTNSGTIEGEVSLGGADSSLLNQGSIDGGVFPYAVYLIGAGSSLDSTHGSVTGEIACGDGGDTVTDGVTGGTVIGGAGNDKLHASPTLAAANNGALTTLDGAGGNNWLIGDGAFVTFDSGDGDGGINHINGRLSRMSDVAGDENNTVSYATLGAPYQSVSVDLLTGIAFMCSSADANTASFGDFTFEDYLQNVPNVIGSSGADTIICDNGVDNITAGGAGSMMYAGAGAGSQDTFVFTSLASSTTTDKDVINGFKTGVDALDFSALNITAANILIKHTAGSHVSSVFVEQTAGTFDAATNLALSVHTTTAAALTTASIVF